MKPSLRMLLMLRRLAPMSVNRAAHVDCEIIGLVFSTETSLPGFPGSNVTATRSASRTVARSAICSGVNGVPRLRPSQFGAS